MIVMCILYTITTLYVPFLTEERLNVVEMLKKKAKTLNTKNSIKNQSFVQKKKGTNRLLPLQFRRQSQHSSHSTGL